MPFTAMALPEPILRALTKLNYVQPTPIQMEAIPLALEGRDLLATAATGTGKTAAFALPILSRMLHDPTLNAMVLVPTRELAVQVAKSFAELGQFCGVRLSVLIGGESMIAQIRQLQNRPRLVIGTPGRVNDHIRRGTLRLSQCNILVLDEMDRMLDMGFAPQIETIISEISDVRQTLLFSATMPPAINALAARLAHNPERIALGQTHRPTDQVTQTMIRVHDADKYDRLLEELNKREGRIIVFARTRFSCEKLAKKLALDGVKVEAMHGDLAQSRRHRVVQDFRNSVIRVLVATDVASRGLDIPDIAHVINHDLPQVAEDFIHRIGRAGRAGATGEAVSFVSPGEHKLWMGIERLLFPDRKPEKLEKIQPLNGPKPKNAGRPQHRKGQSNGQTSGQWQEKRPSTDGAKKPFNAKPAGKPFAKPAGKPSARPAAASSAQAPAGVTPFSKSPRPHRDSGRNEGDRAPQKRPGNFARKA